MSQFSIIYVAFVAIQAGLYFSFSNTIMPVLAAQSPNVGRKIMNDINIKIQNSLFFATLFGPLFIILATFLLRQPITWYDIASFIVYFVGVFLVTVVYNVPLNNRLAKSKEQTTWRNYIERWTFWNHVRTIAAVCALVLIMI